MSSIYSQASEASASASNAPADSRPSNSSNKTQPVSECSRSTGQMSPSTETSPPSSPCSGTTSSAGASPVRTCPSQAREQGSPGPDQVSGTATCTSSTGCAHAGSSSKTWPLLDRVGSIKSYSASQRSGITLDGIAYQPPPLVPLTKGTESGLLPTPRASEWKGCGPKGSKSHNHWISHFYLTALVSDSGKLNPTCAEALMGFPPDWTDV